MIVGNEYDLPRREAVREARADGGQFLGSRPYVETVWRKGVDSRVKDLQ